MTGLTKQDVEVLDKITTRQNTKATNWKDMRKKYDNCSGKLENLKSIFSGFEDAVVLARQAETKRCLKEIEVLLEWTNNHEDDEYKKGYCYSLEVLKKRLSGETK